MLMILYQNLSKCNNKKSGAQRVNAEPLGTEGWIPGGIPHGPGCEPDFWDTPCLLPLPAWLGAEPPFALRWRRVARATA